MSSKSLDISLPPLRNYGVSIRRESNEICEKYPFKNPVVEESQKLTYEQIGLQLIQDELLLTALELYMEVAETGYEIQCLKQFFSNPGNFEKPVARKSNNSESSRFLVRSSSQVTLDSLDFAHLSEDGDRTGIDDRIAVLEFELRKARETINVLRTNLTQAAEQENCSTTNSDCNSSGSQNYAPAPAAVQSEAALRPYDRKALNFLIHEYLLTNGYRLTSITFADENPEQDFENWDDVGLNIERPPDLLNLYRRKSPVQASLSVPTAEAETQTEDDYCLSPKSDAKTEVCDADHEADEEADITLQVPPTPNEPTTIPSIPVKALKGELQHGMEDVYQKLNQFFGSGNRSQSLSTSQEAKNLNPVSQLAGIFRKKL